MRILMQPSGYHLLNMGDTAMLKVATARLSALFPQAVIQTFTHDPHRLASYCPNVIPLSAWVQESWFKDGYLFGSLYRVLSNNQFTEQLRELERGLRRRWPSLVELPIRLRSKLAGLRGEGGNSYLDSLLNADLLVMSGMGGITDAYRQYAFGVLDTLGLAIQHGIPTAMFGQGIGPIQDAKLMARAREILPYVDLIALREDRVGRPLLDSLGVPSSRILTTGDDAIELAYQPLPVGFGKALGVNVRASRCSEVDHGLIDQIRVVLQSAAKAQKAPMIPIPISRVPREDDAVTIRRLIAGYNQVSGSVSDPDTFSKVIEQIRDCRVVVTGSYHAGVFALAQGIPVVGLAKSDYYRDKFLGLADQFGTGCESVFLTDPQWPGTLAAAIDRMWQLAEQVRPRLLDAARRQVELSRAAYQHFRELISSQVRRGLTRRRARPGWH